MSMIANQMIVVHIKQIRNIGITKSGRYCLRFHIYRLAKNKEPIYVTPISIVQSQNLIINHHAQTVQNTYITRSFILKPSSSSIRIQQVCTFKNQFDIFQFGCHDDQYQLNVFCELVAMDFDTKKVVNIFQGKLYGTSGSQYLKIDFFYPYPAQVTGTIHSTIYNYQFQSSPKIKNLQQYCQKQSDQHVEQLFKYILKQVKHNEFKLNQLINLKQQEKQEQNIFNLLTSQFKKIEELFFQKKKTGEQTTQSGQVDWQQNNIIKKRKKIFSHCKKQIKDQTVTIQQFQTIIHQYACKIYQNWNCIVKGLVQFMGVKIIKKLKIQFQKKYDKKIGQCWIRFTGAGDVDNYANEYEYRIKIAEQVRNPPKQHFHQMNQFHFASNRLFSENRPICFQEQDYCINSKQIKKPSNLTIFLVHGLGASRLDMQKIRTQLLRCYQQKVQIIISTANEGRTQGDIAGMSLRLASQVEHHISKFNDKVDKISFIGHSMGGLIIRGALPKLNKYKDSFYSFISLSSPHVGYMYSQSKLIDAGLWIMNNWKKCESLLQLTMQDQQKIENTLLYKMSKYQGLEWFKKVTFISSKQDLYVPYYSARIQKSQQSIIDTSKGLNKGIKNGEIIENILNRIKGKITRIDVNFYIQQQNIDNLIGRAAHISFINNMDLLTILCHNGDRIIF